MYAIKSHMGFLSIDSKTDHAPLFWITEAKNASLYDLHAAANAARGKYECDAFQDGKTPFATTVVKVDQDGNQTRAGAQLDHIVGQLAIIGSEMTGYDRVVLAHAAAAITRLDVDARRECNTANAVTIHREKLLTSIDTAIDVLVTARDDT